MRDYIPRIVDTELKELLKIFGAVEICGPKLCGKTTTGSIHSNSEISMTDPTGDFAGRLMAKEDPTIALDGKTPRLIDEWQEVPKLWDAVRYECDRRGEPGQFILTGSATPSDIDSPMHSGVGRFAKLRMDTMSMFENGKSSGEISLSELLDGKISSGCFGSMSGLNDVAEAVCCGGWPSAVGGTIKTATRIAREYIRTLEESDISRIDGVRRDPAKVRALLASLARNESTLASIKTIAADMGRELGRNTVSQYISALRRLYIVDDVLPWNPALRSPIRLRSASKHHFPDPSLAVAALGADVNSLVSDPKTLGLLFESLVIHDLRIYARVLEAEIYHYHDSSDLEVDAIVAKRNGEWAAFEVKMGTSGIDAATANLLALEKKMISHGERPPMAKCIIIAFGAATHVTDDGIAVVPIDTLGCC